MQTEAEHLNVRLVDFRHHSRAMGALTLAFSADPVCRWVWPSASEFLAGFPAFCRAFGGRAFHTNGAYEVAGCAGAALWLAPGVDANEAEIVAVVEDTVTPALRIPSMH